MDLLAKPKLTREITLSENDLIEKEESVIDEKEIVEEIKFFSNASNLKGVQDQLLLQKKLKKFESKIVKHLAVIEKCLDSEESLECLFLFAMQSFEDYIFMSNKDEKTKLMKVVVCRLLKDFVRDDKLCLNLIKIVGKQIKASTLWRRNKKRIYKSIHFFLKMLV